METILLISIFIYFTIIIFLWKLVWKKSEKIKTIWFRILIRAGILSFAFTPGILVEGHGVAPVPALLILIVDGYRLFALGFQKFNYNAVLYGGILLILAIWFLGFIIRILLRSFGLIPRRLRRFLALPLIPRCLQRGFLFYQIYKTKEVKK